MAYFGQRVHRLNAQRRDLSNIFPKLLNALLDRSVLESGTCLIDGEAG